MVCYSCHADNLPEDSDYCPFCGIKLFVKCPKCGHRHSSQFPICNKCGTNREKFLEKEKERQECLDLWFKLTGSYKGTTILENKKNSVSGQIVIPDGVTEIGDKAFSDCTGLTSIFIPDSVTKIGRGAFRGCTGLSEILISEKNRSYRSLGNCCLTADGRTLVFGCKNSVIPEGVTEIGGSAFSGCTGLTSIMIPNSVTKIGDWSFSGCTGLTSIGIPDNVTEIGRGAFRGCTGLSEILISEKNRSYRSMENCCLTADGRTLVFGCKNSVIPEGVTEIGDSAFGGCTGLTSIEIPNSVTKIGDWLFSGCTSLEEIRIHDKRLINLLPHILRDRVVLI